MRQLGCGQFYMDFYEVHETTNSVYLIVEFIPGKELFKFTENQKSQSEKHVMKTVMNLLIGLKHIHEKGIMHRDLKPENIMVASHKKQYKVRIIDFGLGTFIKPKDYLYPRCGSPGYIAPEVYTHGNAMKYGPKCDVFAVGVIFYIM